MNAEDRLRENIRQMLAQAGLELPSHLEENIEDQFIELLRQYSEASEESKDEVYAIGEGRILQTLQFAQVGNHTRGSTG